MTAYVLMAKLRGEGKAALAESQAVVQWLTRQRNPHGGFSSTQVCCNDYTLSKVQTLGYFCQEMFL